MSGRERFFLALAAVGFIVPNALPLIFSARHGIDLGRYPTPVESPPIAWQRRSIEGDYRA